MLLEAETRVANLLLYSHVPLTLDFGDGSMTVRLVLSLARPSPSPRAWWGFGQGPAHFVTVALSEVFHNWRGRGDVACLGGSSDVLYELANGDVQVKSDLVALQ